MPADEVEIVRRFIETAADDPDSAWSVLAEDVEWQVAALTVPGFPAAFHGPDGVREFFRRWVGSFEDWGFEAEEYLAGPDAVVVQLHQWGRGRGSGAAVDLRFWQVWWLRDGEAVRVAHELDRGVALGAAGLTP